MFEKKFIEADWSKLLGQDHRFKLTSFKKKSDPPLWEQWLQKERNYWGADDKDDKGRFHHHFGTSDPEGALIKYSKKKLADYTDHIKKWRGVFYVGDEVTLVKYLPNKHHILLATKSKGNSQLRDHEDIELWLYEEVSGILKRHIGFTCLGYTSGTLVVMEGSIENEMGERAGESKVYHQQIETKNIQYADGKLMIDDAVFERIYG